MSTLAITVRTIGNWVSVGLLLIVVVGLVRNLYGFFGTKDRFMQAEAEVARLQQANEKLMVQQNLEDESFVVERELRNSLGLSKEGESVVIIPESMIDSAMKNQEAAVQAAQETAHWRKWLALFR